MTRFHDSMAALLFAALAAIALCTGQAHAAGQLI